MIGHNGWQWLTNDLGMDSGESVPRSLQQECIMAMYVVTVDGKPNVWLSSKEAATIALQAIANAVARDVVLKIVEISGDYLTRKAA